jgi:hypothetical protein
MPLIQKPNLNIKETKSNDFEILAGASNFCDIGAVPRQIIYSVAALRNLFPVFIYANGASLAIFPTV